jgi:hypothetical protein
MKSITIHWTDDEGEMHLERLDGDVKSIDAACLWICSAVIFVLFLFGWII